MYWLFETFLQSMGQPIAIRRFIETPPSLMLDLALSKKVVADLSVVQWQEWMELGKDVHWLKQDRYGYRGEFVRLPQLETLVECETTELWECDIQEVQGLAFSKSELNDFATLDDLVETNSPEMIDEITEEKLRTNLAHMEIRILHPPTDDYFVRYQWDGNRIFLINAGGSHHFAAARYIASKLGIAVPLSGKLKSYRFSAQNCRSFSDQFELFALSSRHTFLFHKAMESFQAPFGKYSLPYPYQNENLILLPRHEPRSMKVAVLLRKAEVFDVGRYLNSQTHTQ